LVHLEEGVGEAAAVSYHGETQAGILSYLHSLPALPDYDPDLARQIAAQLPEGSRAARAAVEIALHDLWGQRAGQPLHQLLGIESRPMPTSFTIAIASPEEMAQSAAKACQNGFTTLKLKVGGAADHDILAAVRGAVGSSIRLRVDANAGWSREAALENIPQLIEYDLEMVEQPLAAGDIEGLRSLRQTLKAQGIQVPIFADESIKSAEDVHAHAGAVDGVVVKLMKTAGIQEGLRVIEAARHYGMQIMLSCMVETSVGVTAAAHLAPLCDYADLDGSLLIRNDPYEGLTYEAGTFRLPERPGIGVSRIAAAQN
jgi:L-alanine-DL-glutamate epimerase-like enolase superfamily enzyme